MSEDGQHQAARVQVAFTHECSLGVACSGEKDDTRTVSDMRVSTHSSRIFFRINQA